MSHKEKLSWLIKLLVLTAAIYWFMSDGVPEEVSDQVGITAGGSSAGGGSFWLLVLILAYLGLTLLRSIYRRKVHKPKSNGYKAYQKLKE